MNAYHYVGFSGSKECFSPYRFLIVANGRLSSNGMDRRADLSLHFHTFYQAPIPKTVQSNLLISSPLFGDHVS